MEQQAAPPAQHETFTLADALGQDHTYVVAPHPATEGSALLFELVGIVSEPLSRIGGAAVAGSGDLRALLDADAQTLRGLDWGEVGKALARGLAATDSAKLVRKLLRYTHRDGQPLATDAGFAMAYTANYVEMLWALLRVVRVNRFFPDFGTS